MWFRGWKVKGQGHTYCMLGWSWDHLVTRMEFIACVFSTAYFLLILNPLTFRLLLFVNLCRKSCRSLLWRNVCLILQHSLAPQHALGQWNFCSVQITACLSWSLLSNSMRKMSFSIMRFVIMYFPVWGLGMYKVGLFWSDQINLTGCHYWCKRHKREQSPFSRESVGG